MNYYVLNQNNEIELYDTDRQRLEDTLLFKPELQGQEIQKTEREIIELDSKYVFADEHTEEITEKEELEQAQKEQQENEEALADLKDRMVTADLQGDEDWKSDLREEYAELMGEGEEDSEEE